MQGRNYRKYVGIILANTMGNQLYPLTKNNPISNLSIGNKKLISYQLEQLQSVPEMNTIIIIYSSDSVKIKQYIQSQFLIKHTAYPHTIQFFRVQNNISEYACIQKLLNSTICDGFQQVKGVFIVPTDVISSIKFNTIMNQHIQKQSDVSMLLKQKKQYGKDQKKPDFDPQPYIDIAMISQNGQVYALRSIENYQYAGFSLPASVYQRVSKATFQKVIDTKIYIFSQRVVKIIKNLITSQLSHLKTDFIDTVIRNQTNLTLLNYGNHKTQEPLKVVAKLAGQNQYIRRISNVKIYESLNLDSLIRGPKQKEVTMPNNYTQSIDEKLMTQFRGNLIGTGCQIQSGIKLTRNVIQNQCKIGKNVDISNSIIMNGTVIEDNCKISNSIISPNCIIKSQSSINSCQLAMNCIVEKGSNNQKQIMIPVQ